MDVCVTLLDEGMNLAQLRGCQSRGSPIWDLTSHSTVGVILGQVYSNVTC